MNQPRAIVIGAGLTGLVTAWHLQQQGVAVTLYEASQRVGGNIATQQLGAYLVETGPNSLQLNDEVYTLLEALGIADDILPSQPAAKDRFVLKGGRYQKVPGSPPQLLLSGLFSWQTKWRILRELRLPAGHRPGESVDGFFRRRFGDEVTDYLVYPFISGIYAGHPDRLLVEAAFPQLVQYEQEAGSVLKGLTRAVKGRRRKGIVSFADGLGRLVETMAQDLGHALNLGHAVRGFERVDGRWRVQHAHGEDEADLLFPCVPAPALATMLPASLTALQDALLRIRHPHLAVVHTAYFRQDFSSPPQGFGALHNRIEPSETLGTIFASSIFPNRCPEDQVMLATFVGGEMMPEAADAPDQQLLAAAMADHERFLQVQGLPVFSMVTRWAQAIPQYDDAIVAAQMAAAAAERDGLAFGGNWRSGISLPACIARGIQLSQPPFSG